MQISSISSYGYSYGKSSSSVSASSSSDYFEKLLRNVQQQTSDKSSQGDTVSLSSSFTDLQSFLDKVKDGTVTEGDLQDMQEELSSDSSQYAAMPPMMSGSSASDTESIDTTDLASFLQKVQAGTVTDTDLQAIKDKLTEMQEEYQTTSQTGDNTANIDFKTFLDKVKDGTVTDTDLQDMQELLNSDESSMGMPPIGAKPPMGGQPPMMGGAEQSTTTSSGLDSSAESQTSTTSTDETNDWLEYLQTLVSNIYADKYDTSQWGTLQDIKA